MSILSRGWCRKACAVTIFLAAALLQVFFKDVPWPLNIDAVENLHSASASLGAQELVLGGATVASHHNFLTYDGGPFETVDLDFDRAQLGEATSTLLSTFPPAPPLDASAWHFITHEDASADTGDSCRCFLTVEQSGSSSAANEFHLLQLGQPGLNHARQLEVRTDAASLIVNIKTDWPPGRENKALGCHKRLQSGDWFRGIVNHPVQFVVLPQSAFRIEFVSLFPAGWGGPDKPLRSAQLGPLLAKELTLRPIQEDGTVATEPAELHLSAYRDSKLRIRDLIVGSDTLQVSMSGKAWADLKGKAQGFDLWDAMQKNAMFAALLGSANVLLLGWLRKLFFGRDPEPQLKSAESDA